MLRQPTRQNGQAQPSEKMKVAGVRDPPLPTFLSILASICIRIIIRSLVPEFEVHTGIV
jgi:hypothetical protein